MAASVLTKDRLALVSWGDEEEQPIPTVDEAVSINEKPGEEKSNNSEGSSTAPSTGDRVDGSQRTYHQRGQYLLPNDVKELRRLDMQHEAFVFTTVGKLHLAPLKPDKVRNVLD